MSNSVHYADLQAPIACRMVIFLGDEGELLDLNYQLFAEPEGDDEFLLARSTSFARDMVQKAEKKGLLVEDVLRRFKDVAVYAQEYAIIKAIEAAQATFWRLGTLHRIKPGRAA